MPQQLYESTTRDLRVQVKKLETEKRELDKQLENLHGALLLFEQKGDTGRRNKGTVGQELGGAIFSILTFDRPLHRKDILTRVQERGLHVGGDNPVNAVGAYLSVDDRFKNVGQGVWTLREEEAGAVNGRSDVPDEGTDDTND